MTVLELKIMPDPVLRAATQEVDAFDSTLHKFLDDMFETMIAENGLGLAAPQVGVSKRIAVIDLSLDAMKPPTITSLSSLEPEQHLHNQRLEIINPTLDLAGRIVSSDEGCLSIPEYRDTIKRHDTVTLSAFDRNGKQYKLQAVELLAFAIQHEVDHLHGVLFVDHLSRLKKQLFQRWCTKHLPMTPA
jgi:peptide deformylase